MNISNEFLWVFVTSLVTYGQRMSLHAVLPITLFLNWSLFLHAVLLLSSVHEEILLLFICCINIFLQGYGVVLVNTDEAGNLLVTNFRLIFVVSMAYYHHLATFMWKGRSCPFHLLHKFFSNKTSHDPWHYIVKTMPQIISVLIF